MRMCLNRKVLVGLALAGLAIFLVAPSALGSALPLLVVLACPLSMVFMMRGMSGNRCETEGAATDTGATADQPADRELTRLRAEIDQLRAELGERRPSATDR